MIAIKQRTPEETEQLIHTLAWNKGFGCYTRAGFEYLVWPEIAAKAKWIIYFDINDMHGLNAVYGYDTVDAKIKDSLSILRLTDYAAGQLKSGDEFLVCLTENDRRLVSGDRRIVLDATKLLERLRAELKKRGIDATFALVPVVSPDLHTNVAPAIDIVYQVKNGRPGGSTRKS